ncbi:MAG TPA: hypothetical protein VGG99_03555 [Acetobacteraceae bacterium]|jgi:hypothetical protein
MPANQPPIFHVIRRGALANQMIQFMVALKFRSLVPECRISNVDLPLWGISHPPIEGGEPVEVQRSELRLDLYDWARRMRSGALCRGVFSCFGQRVEHFLHPAYYRSIFRSPEFPQPVGFDDRHLVCHVRAGEILDGHAVNYTLTPIEFYAELIERTGLRPVFMGQTGVNSYTLRLRERFPSAIFLETRDVIVDFETIRQSKNVVVGVSTFAWLAAWLSRADRIFMTVSGLLHPMQYPLADLLPFGDSRYHFFLFPINYAVPLDRHAEAHRRIAHMWRYVPQELLRRQMKEAPRFACTPDMMANEVDPEFYLNTHTDVTLEIASRTAAAARHHYRNWGFHEGRLPFRMDLAWYAVQYPIAAFEVAQGDYRDFPHHYVAVGRARGYRPMPD